MTMILRPLGELITVIPATVEEYHPNAGPTFETDMDITLPSQKLNAWVFLHERLVRMTDECQRLNERLNNSEEPWAASIRKRFAFLAENMEGIAANFDRDMKINSSYLRLMLENISQKS